MGELTGSLAARLDSLHGHGFLRARRSHACNVSTVVVGRNGFGDRGRVHRARDGAQPEG
jgi:ribosomal protein L18